MGVEVFSANLDEDAFGLIHGTEDGTQIYVDRAQPPNRYRFTVAHEIGHYVEHAQRGEGADVAYVDRRSDPGGYDPEETFANHFAGALLMPRPAVLRWVASGQNDFALADVFGVSLQAWRLRRAHVGV
jgi:Zn-dependent peptidase ImmA (M78 family)